MLNKCECKENLLTKNLKLKVVDNKHRVGANVKIQPSIIKTLDQKCARNCKCVQFFLGNSKSYNCRTINIEDKQNTIEYCDKYNKSFYIHCPYIANLSKDPNTQYVTSSILHKSMNLVQKEINQLKDLPAGCILHIGSKGTIHNVIENINNMDIERGKHDRVQKPLILENSAGQGTSLGRSWEELRKIFEGLDKNTIGLCIDTQHLYGSGLSEIKNHEDMVKIFDNIEHVYGKKPDVIHLNDSKISFNENKDRHQNLGKGYIWSNNDEGLKYLLNRCYEDSIDVILETPNSSQDIDIIQTKYMDLETIDVFSI